MRNRAASGKSARHAKYCTMEVVHDKIEADNTKEVQVYIWASIQCISPTKSEARTSRDDVLQVSEELGKEADSVGTYSLRRARDSLHCPGLSPSGDQTMEPPVSP